MPLTQKPTKRHKGENRAFPFKISAIFSDYDGTLAPEDASLEASAVPQEIEEPLAALGSSVPVAIVTSKDCAFVRPRTKFACAWACVSGLEIVLSDGRTFALPHRNDRLQEALSYVRAHHGLGLDLELKRSTKGDLLAFSVDWRKADRPPTRFIGTATARLARMELSVVYDPTKTYFDVFGGMPDKGRAVRELRRLLKVAGKILYIGDSAADNLAFQEADVAICIAHGQSLEGLSCGFELKHEDLGTFLRSLADNQLSLDPRDLARR